MATVHSISASTRQRWLVPLGAITALALLAAWFPFSTLLSQESTLRSTQAQISALQKQAAGLANESKSVNSATNARNLAREQYQLVSPGQSLIQILPGKNAPLQSSGAGDPGSQGLVAPTSGLSGTVSTPTSPSKSGFFTRLLHTLEFWR